MFWQSCWCTFRLHQLYFYPTISSRPWLTSRYGILNQIIEFVRPHLTVSWLFGDRYSWSIFLIDCDLRVFSWGGLQLPCFRHFLPRRIFESSRHANFTEIHPRSTCEYSSDDEHDRPTFAHRRLATALGDIYQILASRLPNLGISLTDGSCFHWSPTIKDPQVGVPKHLS